MKKISMLCLATICAGVFAAFLTTTLADDPAKTGSATISDSPNRAKGGTASAGSETPPGEVAASAFDGSADTKWCNNGQSNADWLQYHFASGVAWAITRYSLTSANDVPGRDPKDWELQGSHDGTTWATLDKQTGQVFESRFQVKTYKISNATAYEYYRLNITANSGDASIQLAELALYEK